MKLSRVRLFIPFLCVCVLSIAILAGCRPRKSSGTRYDFKGKVVSVEKDKQQVTVAHDEIKGYMPAMVMPFKLKEAWPLEILAPGDVITAALVVDGGSSWLEEVTVRQESIDAAAGTTSDNEVKPGADVPNYGLVNQDSKPIKLHDYHGKALLLTFIYTRCPLPDYCDLMSNNFAQVDEELQKQGEIYQRTHLLSISIDPAYDTPQVLRSYGAAHTGRYSDETFAHWEFASGTKDQVKGIAQFFGLRYYEGGDQIIHGLRTVIITPEGKVFKVYRSNDWKPAEAASELVKALQATTTK
ncbi:MAG: electron transport protein SCO1/SenC [Acidobacteria bacterium]|nr:electron transport protein SCO1/SenC [Acidobacteriota bacterium]